MKNIDGFSRYKLSVHGVLFDMETYREVKFKIVDRYLGASLKDDKNVRRTKYLHRLLAECYVPDRCNSGKRVVNHINGNRLDNSISNLEWCSQSENIIHSFSIGLSKVSNKNKKGGKKNGKKVIVNGIHYDSVTAAAKENGVSQSMISKILTGAHCSSKLKASFV